MGGQHAGVPGSWQGVTGRRLMAVPVRRGEEGGETARQTAVRLAGMRGRRSKAARGEGGGQGRWSVAALPGGRTVGPGS